MHTEPIADEVGVVVEPTGERSILDLDREAVVKLFTESGAVLFRGFGLDLDGFNRFSGSLSAGFLTYRGGSYVRRGVRDSTDPTLLSTSHEFGSATQDTFALPLHGEMYYLDQRPAVLWFYCVQPAATDGETTICDGSAIHAALRPSTRQLLEDKRLLYVRRYPEGTWQRIYGTDDVAEVGRFCRANGLEFTFVEESRTVHTRYLHPAVVTTRWGGRRAYINNLLPVVWQESTVREDSIVRLEDGSRVPPDVVDELVEIQRRRTVPVAWQRQDLVMLDNSRFLHGRRAFTDPAREICLRMAADVPF